ncbi:MAG: hypothetical protein LBR89_02735 [Holosporales bacterium]|jgi:opacity protein-like surface antigen|nr:hypothetical protein [Holosporales bacterium]
MFACLVAAGLPSSLAHARIQFYVGANLQKNNVRHQITFATDYLSQYVSDVYIKALDATYADMLAFAKSGGLTSLKSSTPRELLQALMNDHPAEFHKTRPSSVAYSFTVGAFVARHEKVLLAVEAFWGRERMSEDESSKITIVSGAAPDAILNTAPSKEGARTVVVLNQDSKLNPTEYSLRPYSYLHGSIEIGNELKVERNTYCGAQLRLGSVVADRMYAYAVLGADVSNVHVKSTHKWSDFPQFVLYTCSPTYIGANIIKFLKYTLDPSTTSSQDLAFDKSKYVVGIVGGLGGEFFMSRTLSVRMDLTYSYFPDKRIPSTNSKAELQYTSTNWRLGVGVCWRF